jgi:hypothetical protein
MDDFKITKREILVSIIVIAIMLLIGIVIHDNINDKLMLEYQKYNTALQIDNDSNLFVYGMKTNIGNAFVYGDLKAVDPVTYSEIDGEYSYVEKVKEKYTRHTRTVTKTRTVNGKTQTYTETEEYWTWDVVDRESKQATKITFLDVGFDYGMIDFPSSNYITTQKESSKIRYKYYGSPAECVGTLYAVLENDTINEVKFYNNHTINETLDSLKTGWQLILFWIGWILLTGGCVFGFYYIDNKWLEDKLNN